MMGDSRSTEDPISKLNRNDPCHCGSGKKYKKCHLVEDEAARTAELAAKNAEIAQAAREAAEQDPEGAALEEKKSVAAKAKARAAKPPPAAPTARQARRRGVA
jgi:hypothetical protein